MELFHKHYHIDQYENLENRIVVVEVRYHFRRKEHNETKVENQIFEMKTEEVMVYLYEMDHRIPRDDQNRRSNNLAFDLPDLRSYQIIL